MAKFTDKHGLDWSIRIDLSTVWDYKTETGADIFALVAAGRIPVTDLLGLAYVAVAKTARQRGFKSRQDWLRGIGKEAAMPLADVVAAEVAEFFPETPDDEAADGADPQTPDRGDGKA